MLLQTIPCNLREKVNRMGQQTINIEDTFGKIYQVMLRKTTAVTFIHGAVWQHFIDVHGIHENDEVSFHFQDESTILALAYRYEKIHDDGENRIGKNLA